MLNFDDYSFSVPETLQITGVDRKTFENWLTHGHIPQGANWGRERRFCFADLLTIKLVEVLRSRFKVQVATASFLAHKMVEDYAPRFPQDCEEIYAGKGIGATSYRPAYDLVKKQDGSLEAVTGEQISDDSMMIVVPVGIFARGIIWSEKARIESLLDDMKGVPANDGGNAERQSVK